MVEDKTTSPEIFQPDNQAILVLNKPLFSVVIDNPYRTTPYEEGVTIMIAWKTIRELANPIVQ